MKWNSLLLVNLALLVCPVKAATITSLSPDPSFVGYTYTGYNYIGLVTESTIANIPVGTPFQASVEVIPSLNLVFFDFTTPQFSWQSPAFSGRCDLSNSGSAWGFGTEINETLAIDANHFDGVGFENVTFTAGFLTFDPFARAGDSLTAFATIPDISSTALLLAGTLGTLALVRHRLSWSSR